MEKLFIFLSLLVSTFELGMETVIAQNTYDHNGHSKEFYIQLFYVLIDGLLSVILISSFWFTVEANLHMTSRKLLFIIINLHALSYLVPAVIVASNAEKYKTTSNIIYSIWTMSAGVWLLFCLYRYYKFIKG